MTVRGYLRGHPIIWDGENWVYEDTGEVTSYETRVSWYDERPCVVCGEYRTPEGHDPCLGTLPGVENACCGHGNPREAYIVFENGCRIEGFTLDQQIHGSSFRGHPVYWDGMWKYEDNAESAGFDGVVRPCAKCGLVFQGSNRGDPDPCMGLLPGVDNACCGHGIREDAYIRFTNGMVVTGFDKVEYNWRPEEEDDDFWYRSKLRRFSV